MRKSSRISLHLGVSVLSVLLLAALAIPASAQLQGGNSYPIDGTENPPVSFASITSAVTYMTASGVTGSGQVWLELSPGYAGEAGPVTIGAIPGVSATLGVTFRPDSGYVATSEIAGGSSTQWAIRIAGSYITLDGQGGGGGGGRDWTIRCTGSGTSGYGQSAVRIDNTSGSLTDIAVRYCILEAEAANTTSAIFGMTGSTSNTLKNLIVEENLIRSTGLTSPNCRGYGMSLATISNAGNTGWIIRNNTFNDTYANGIRLTGGFPGALIYGNEIYHTATITQPSATEYSGIYFSTSASAGTQIYDNLVYDIKLAGASSAVNGLYFYTANSTGDRIKVYNNRVAIGPGVVSAIDIFGIREYTSSGGLIDYDYNSVWIGGSPTSGSNNSAAFRKQSSGVLNVRNNIFYNARSNNGATGTHWAIMANNTTFASINYNDYYADGTGGVLGTTTGATGGNVTTLAAWKAAVPADVASVSQDPHYVNAAGSPPDLHLDATIASQLESGGTAIAGIDYDFEGDIRYGSAGYSGTGTAPDIGADEMEGLPLDLTPPVITYIPLANDAGTTTREFTDVAVTDASGVNGSAGTRPRVYYKKYGDANTWGDNTSATDGWKYAEANGSTSPFDFTIDYSLVYGGSVASGDTIQYFVVAQDLASTPNVGINSGTFAAQPASVDLTTAAFPITGTINSYLIVGTLAGEFTVGTGGDYETLKGAFDDINLNVVAGEITLTILASGTTETASAVLNAVAYQGGPWTITIKPEAGATPTITGAIGGALVKLNGADHVVIDGSNSAGGTTRDLTFANTSTAASGVIWMNSLGAGQGATDNTVKNCIVLAGADQSTGTTETWGIVCSGTSMSTTGYGADNDNITIANNEVRKVRWGIYVLGISGNPNETYLIEGNLIGPAAFGSESIGRGGITIRYTNHATIQDNEVRCVGGTYALTSSGTDRVGIGVGGDIWSPTPTTAGGCVVQRNVVHDIVEERTFSAVGIVVAGQGSPSGNLIVNNMIYNVYANGTSGDQGICIGIIDGNGDTIAYNSVYVAGDIDPTGASNATQSQVGIRIANTTPANLTLKNNIFSVDVNSNTATLKHYAIVAPSTSYAWGTGGCDNNDYYVNPANPQMVLGGIGTTVPYTEVPTLASWRTQFTPNQDGFSVSSNPPFVSATDLHLLTDVPTPLESGGTPITGVGYDYDGDARNATTPDIGADEGDFTVLLEHDIAAVAFIDPTNGGTKIAGTPFNPRASFENLGLEVENDVVVRFRIVDETSTEVYNEVDTLTVINPGTGPETATFPEFSFSTGGAYTMYAKSELPGDDNPSNDEITGTVTVFAPLAGVYDVGAAEPAPFNSLTNAIGALNTVGVSAPVTFVLVDASYTAPAETFPLTINAYPGASETNTFTIRPAGPGTTISGTSTTAAIVLNGADYVTIDGSSGLLRARDLTIVNTSTSSTTAVLWLKSLGADLGCVNNTIQNCILMAGADQSTTTTVTYGVIVTGSTISTSTGGNDNDGNAFIGNEVRKTRWGIYLVGVSGNLNANNVVSGNLVGPEAFGSEQIGQGGIVGTYQDHVSITGNEVRFVGGTYATTTGGADRTGIGLGAPGWPPTAAATINSVVTGNLIHDVVEERTYGAVGIVMAASGTPSANLVANNMIYNVRGNGTGSDQCIGLGIAAGDGDTVVYNSIAMSGDLDPGSSSATSQSSAGIRISSTTPANLTLKNNIISADVNSNTSTLKHYAIVAPSTSYAWGTGGCDNNDYYANPANPQMVLGGIGTTVPYTQVSTLAEWRTQFTPNQDSSSVSANPPFASATDLHLLTTVPTALESGGTPITGVEYDYDGDARNATTPDMGADEGDFTPLFEHDIAAVAFIDPTNGGTKIAGTPFSPQASFENAGLNVENDVQVRFRIVDETSTEIYNEVDTLAVMNPAGGPQTATFAEINLSSAGTFTMYAKSELPGDDNPGNDEIIGTFTVLAPLAGVYDVGAAEPAPFNSLTNAIGALNTVGVSAPVTFVLVDASYTAPAETFPLTINAYPGASETNTFTIRPAGPGTTISGTSTTAAIVLNGADYVTIDGSSGLLRARDLTIVNTSTSSTTAVLWLKSLGADLGCVNNTIQNCILMAGADQSTTTTVTYGVIVTGSTISTSTGGNDNDGNAFIGNEVRKTRWGIYLVGVSGNLNANNVVSGNLVGPEAFGSEQIGQGGIVGTYQDHVSITGNEVRFVGGTYATTTSGADRMGIGLGAGGWSPTATATINSVVTGNLIHEVVEERTYSAVGIIVAGSGTPSANLVANNMIFGVRSNGTAGDQSIGLGIGGGDGDTVAYNSISLSGDLDPGTATSASYSGCGIRISSTTPANLTLKDNIISVDYTSNTATLMHFAIVAPATTYAWGTGGSNNNDYFVNAANPQMVLGGVGTSIPYTYVTTLAGWQAVFTPGQDSLSISADPLFVGPTDLHISTAGPISPVSNAGVPLAAVTTDYDGDLRNATTPDIGADEFTIVVPVNISIADVQVVEGNPGDPNPIAAFAVTLDAAPVDSVWVSYTTLDSTATVANNDYVAAAGLLVFAPGEVADTILVTVVPDSTWEPDECFMVVLSDPVGATIADPVGVGTILNDDEFSGVEPNEIPKATFLAGSRPNPAAGAATIFYGLSAPSHVKLDLYDLQGRLVRRLADGPETAGYKRVVWDGRDGRGHSVGSGFYFLRLKTEEKTYTKPIRILR